MPPRAGRRESETRQRSRSKRENRRQPGEVSVSQESKLVLPTPVPVRPYRQPQSNIPPSKLERDALQEAIRGYVKSGELVPPIPLSELREITAKFLAEEKLRCEVSRVCCRPLQQRALAVPHFATIPYERRLLLMPKCLRYEAHCPAPFDEFGLLCKKCGMCTIQDLQTAAENLGYAVLVAEGSPVVMAIIERQDRRDRRRELPECSRAGVPRTCEAGAVPGVAIPLLQDDCVDTMVDEDWVWTSSTSPARIGRTA